MSYKTAKQMRALANVKNFVSKLDKDFVKGLRQDNEDHAAELITNDLTKRLESQEACIYKALSFRGKTSGYEIRFKNYSFEFEYNFNTGKIRIQRKYFKGRYEYAYVSPEYLKEKGLGMIAIVNRLNEQAA